MARFDKHIIIVGSARSGTSWLAETIAKQHRYRLLFEPDHEFQTKSGHLLCDKWIKDFKTDKDAHSYLKKVFANRVDSDWIAQNSNRKLKRHLWPFIPKKIVVKFVRANLMAATMQMEFGIPVLHIIRNPYDVIASQMRVKFPWLFDLEHFKNQPELVAKLKGKYQFDLLQKTTFSEIEVLAIRWCIENCNMDNISEIKKITYESLRGNVPAFKDLCLKYNLVPVANLDEQFKKPSSKTHPKSEIIAPQNSELIFKADDYAAINKILDIFNIELYKRVTQ